MQEIWKKTVFFLFLDAIFNVKKTNSNEMENFILITFFGCKILSVIFFVSFFFFFSFSFSFAFSLLVYKWLISKLIWILCYIFSLSNLYKKKSSSLFWSIYFKSKFYLQIIFLPSKMEVFVLENVEIVFLFLDLVSIILFENGLFWVPPQVSDWALKYMLSWAKPGWKVKRFDSLFFFELRLFLTTNGKFGVFTGLYCSNIVKQY